MGGHGFDGDGGGAEQHGRMRDVTEKLERGTERLEQAQRSIAETEDIAVGILDDLGRNRMTIESSRNKAREAMGMTSVARRITSSMSRRNILQKYAVYGLIGCVALVVIIIIVWTSSS